MKKTISVLAIFCLLLTSCDRKVEMKFPPLDNVYDRFGKVEGYSISKDKPKMVTYYKSTGWEIFHQRPGEMEDRIRRNPGWQFVFIVDGPPKDTTYIMGLLNQQELNIPVIFDFDHYFTKHAHYQPAGISDVGYIVDKDNIIRGSIGSACTDYSNMITEFKKWGGRY